jgi:hypothetical protein
MDIFDAGKKAIAAAQDFSKDCNKQLDDYYNQYIKPKEITAPEKVWDRDVKDLDQLITAMQKAGKFWHGEVEGAFPGYGSGDSSAIMKAKTLLKTMESKIANSKE